jgi:hypothetical protein
MRPQTGDRVRQQATNLRRHAHQAKHPVLHRPVTARESLVHKEAVRQ